MYSKKSYIILCYGYHYFYPSYQIPLFLYRVHNLEIASVKNNYFAVADKS